MKKILSIVIIILAVISAGAGSWWVYTQMQPASQIETSRYITIEEGASAGEVAQVLEKEGVIRNGTVFYLYTRFYKHAPNIKSGFYRFSPHHEITEILEILTEGRTENITVRIPSGVDLIEITSLMEEEGFSENEIRTALNRRYDIDILKHKPDNVGLEGYIYPDTYHIAANSSAADLIETTLVNTQQHITSDLKRQWEKHGLSVHEGLTLASIVQKEIADPEDQAQVAQVFLARLEDNQPLEADPTFMYAAKKNQKPVSVDIDSPYNTYQNKGLPPGPIATVTLDSLQAVAYPADTEYKYFVTGEDGVTRFSKTRQQHEKYIDRHGVSGS